VDLSLLLTENSNNIKNDKSTKIEHDTFKKSEVVSNDDKMSKITAPKALVHVTSSPAKASEQRSRLSPTHHKDKPKPPTIVGVANQLLQPEGSAKAGLVVSPRTKEFKGTPHNQAEPLAAGHQRSSNFDAHLEKVQKLLDATRVTDAHPAALESRRTHATSCSSACGS